MRRRSRRCSEKTSDVQLAETSCDLGYPREALFAATRLSPGRAASGDYRYVTKRSGDEDLRDRLRELATQRRRFGYRRLGLMSSARASSSAPKSFSGFTGRNG